MSDLGCAVCLDDKCSRIRCANDACATLCCKENIMRYITSVFEVAHCFGCKTAYPRGYMIHHFGKEWYQAVYKPHLLDILFERERLRMAGEQEIAKLTLEKRLLEEGKSETGGVAIRARVREIEARISVLWPGRRGSRAEGPPKQKICGVCPAADCRGFLVQWKCGLCGLSVCEECGSSLAAPPPVGPSGTSAAGVPEKSPGDFHACDPQTRETFRLIQESCKPCPNCAVPITKIMGCNQMFCTACRIPFDWRTGKIRRHGVQGHYPHYAEWLTSHGILTADTRAPRASGGPLTAIPSHLRHEYELFFELQEFVDHASECLVPQWRRSMGGGAAEDAADRGKRIDYLTGKIDKNALMRGILLRRNYRAASSERADILTAFTETARDILRVVAEDSALDANARWERSAHGAPDIRNEAVKEIGALIGIVNAGFEDSARDNGATVACQILFKKDAVGARFTLRQVPTASKSRAGNKWGS